MIPSLLLAAATLMVGVASGVALGLKLAGRRIVVVEVPAPCIPPSAQLAAALAMNALQEARIAVLTTAQYTPASQYLELPVSPAYDHVEAHTVQGLADANQDLLAVITALENRLVVSERRRARHWNSLKRLRKAVVRMVSAHDLANTEALRMRSLSVAKTAQSRAAEYSTALTEIEVARMESMTLDEFNESFEAILDNHGIERVTA